MPRRMLRLCAWGAWLSVLPIPAVPDDGTPPPPTLDAEVEGLVREGTEALRHGKIAQAEERFGQALAAQEELGRADIHTARILTRLGEIGVHRGKPDEAQVHLERALALLQVAAPQGTEMADALSILGMVARGREDLDLAQAQLDRALALLQVAAPESAGMAEVLNKMGLVARDRFELDGAQEHFRRSLTLYEKCRPGGIERAHVLHNLGVTAESRRDFAAADHYYRRALAIEEKLAPSGLAIAHTLNNLGTVATSREDLISAESYSRRSLALFEALVPDSLKVATALANLGGVMRRRGNFAAAGAPLRRALAVRERLVAPDSLVLAVSLRQLGALARDQGDLKQAESLARRTLAIEQGRRPGGFRVAITLSTLGELALDDGRWDEAELHLAGALSITERLYPDSSAQARIRHLRGRLFRQRGRLVEAGEEMRRAVDALEVQIGMLGGLSEDRAEYRARRSVFYTDLVDLLVQLQDARAAFHVLERSRARGFLEMMTTRDLALAERVPVALESNRRRLALQYDRAQKRLTEQDGRAASAAIARLQEEARDLRRRHSTLVEEIRRQSPGSSLRFPQPFDLAATKAALEPGVLLLSYAVGDERTHVFAVSREDGLTVETLAVGRAALQRDVELFRRLIQEAAPATPRIAQLADVGRRLYQSLIAPVAPRIERCQRVVIVPDGPLHVLPFAALVRERGEGRAATPPGRYFVEWKPVSTVLSATVYGELRQRRIVNGAAKGADAAPTLVAFGDPALPRGSRGADAADPERSLLNEVTGLRPLPAARHEVDRIAALFPGSAEALVGGRATEERVKELPARVRYVHFATHAVFDQTSPMESALVLAAPGDGKALRENGLLQAWEILEQLRLDSDLVVLSACDSGLGRERRGEGLLGLTRAFQHAGAASVVASLWRVGDQATAALMVRFYRHLKEGRAKDDALRAAQMEMIAGRLPVKDRAGRHKDISSPYHWAAFQLYGDGQ